MPDSRQTTCARLIWILPLVQVAFAEFCWYMAAHSHPPIRGDFYWRSTLDLFSAGLNAPVDHMNFVLNELEDFRGGVLLGHIQYMLLVAVLWHLVARRICRFRSISSNEPDRVSVPAILLDLFLMLYGLDMLLVISFHNIVFTPTHFGNGQTSNFIGDVLHQGFFFLWSLALLAVPAATLYGMLRRKNLRSKPA